MRSMWRLQYWIGWSGSFSTKCESQGSAGKTLKIRNEDQRDVPRLTSKSQPHGCRLQFSGIWQDRATVPAGIRRKRQWLRCNLDSQHRTTHQANWELLQDHCRAGRIRRRRAGCVWIQGLLCTYVRPFLSGHSLMHVKAIAGGLRQKGANITPMIQEDILAYHVRCEPLQLGLPESWVTGPC